MKNIFLTLILILPLVLFGQDINYAGKWTISGDSFENTLVLEKIEGKENTYKFSFDGWRKSYDTFARKNVKFLGGMSEDFFILEIKDNKAYYSDDGLVLDEELPIYDKGEERCKVYFTFYQGSISVETVACAMIYGGFGVTFDGTYKKN
jgi:regulation of enolase protein 1 (concanavalin A-like superfamily)